jgi:hypothetical protein
MHMLLDYSMAVSMSQNMKDPIEWLVETYGGSMRFVKGKRSYDRGIYERWNWIISTAAAADFLRIIYPYSIVKQKEILIALAFQDSMKITGRAKLPKLLLDISVLNKLEK